MKFYFRVSHFSPGAYIPSTRRYNIILDSDFLVVHSKGKPVTTACLENGILWVPPSNHNILDVDRTEVYTVTESLFFLN